MKTTMITKRIIALLVTLWIFGGCSLKEAPPLNLYTFPTPIMEPAEWAPTQGKILKVAFPLSLKEPLTYKMAYAYDNDQCGYYQNSQWSNHVNKMLQGYLIQTLIKSGLFKAVVSDKSSIPEDQRLESMVYDFTHRINGTSSYADISIEFALMDMRSGKLIRRIRLTYAEPTPTIDAKGYVTATHRALQKLSQDLIRWLRGSVR